MTLGEAVQRIQDKFQFDLTQWPQVGQLTRRVAEQMAHEHPRTAWGYFNHPHGREDVVGYSEQRDDGARRTGFDIVIAAGGPTPALNTRPDPMDMTGRGFVAVGAVNHLVPALPEEPPLPPPNPVPSPAPDDVLMAIAQVQLRLSTLAGQVRDIQTAVQRVARHFTDD